MLNPGDSVEVAAGHKWAGARGVVIGPSLVKPGRLVVRSDRTGGEIAFKPSDLIRIDLPALGDQPSENESPTGQAFSAPLPSPGARSHEETHATEGIPLASPSPGGLLNCGDDLHLAQFVDLSPISPIASAVYPESLADVILNSPIGIAALQITKSRQRVDRITLPDSISRQDDQRAIRIEEYQNRAGTYYRLAWSEGHQKLTRHIPGGNIHSQRSRDRVLRLTACINQGGNVADCLKLLRD
jgi:hypothetical protein